LDESKNSLKAIETVTAINAFDAVLNSNLNRVIIGQLNYEMLINKKEELPIYFDKKLSKVMRNKELKLKKNKSDNVKTLKEEVQLKGFGEDNVFTETEIKLAGIWAQVLGLEEVNIYDSFNNMGGDSILAIRLLKKLELEYEGMIDIADVFAYSTVNAMAKHLDEMKNKDNKTEVIIKEDLEDLDDLLNKLAQGEMTINDADKYF
jgi:polyketide synthase PksN